MALVPGIKLGPYEILAPLGAGGMGLGGDKAVIDPKRAVSAIQLRLGREPSLVDATEAGLYSKMIDKSVLASSMGRVLDSVSCILGVCCKRTYEGEPAIKLERWIERGRPDTRFAVEFGHKDGVEYAKTFEMFDQLLDIRIESDTQRADAAASFVRSLVQALAERACDFGDKDGIMQQWMARLVDGKSVVMQLTRNKLDSYGNMPSRFHLENYQQADGTIRIPAVLLPYMGGRERIGCP